MILDYSDRQTQAVAYSPEVDSWVVLDEIVDFHPRRLVKKACIFMVTCPKYERYGEQEPLLVVNVSDCGHTNITSLRGGDG